MSSAIRYELYRREILRYIASMSIKFTPFAEMIERHVSSNTDFQINHYSENPYYRNLCGEYSFLDTPMEVWSVEANKFVTFDKDLWRDYPQTASLYDIGSDAYQRLCLTYPSQVGLIKGIIYPVEDMRMAYEAEELTILRHVPTFLESNEQESLHTAAVECLEYLKSRWFIYDYGHEDQYFLVFMAQVYFNLFSCLLAKRIENQDTAAVHSQHVWERLEAHGLRKYENILNPKQARWFYRNLRYLKENRGRKSNLILLADNLLKNLKVHLVGKKIFQQTIDPDDTCLMVPEFLSEEIVDYSLRIPESIGSLEAIQTEDDFFLTTDKRSNSTTSLVDMNTRESMDRILSRINGEGYYPQYSIDDSFEKEAKFGRTTANNVPARLLEFQKYEINAPYFRRMVLFLFDSLMYHSSRNKLFYKLEFVDPNTNIPVSLTVENAIALLHYSCHRQARKSAKVVNASYLPRVCELDTAYRATRPIGLELPTHFHFNSYNYRIDSILNTEFILNRIPWINDKKFTTAASFVKQLGKQFRVMVGHIREAATECHFTTQHALCYFYKFLLTNEVVTLREQQITFTQWFPTVPGINTLVSAYDAMSSTGAAYAELAELLIRKLLPTEESEDLMAYATAIYDDTLVYDQLKAMFMEWTSHDLTYLDTDRAQITYIDVTPIAVTTSAETIKLETEITGSGLEATSYLNEAAPYDFSKQFYKGLELAESPQAEKTTIGLFGEAAHLRDVTEIVVGEKVFYERFDLLHTSLVERVEQEMNLKMLHQLSNTGIRLMDASVPGN